MTVPVRATYAYEQSSEAGRERHILMPQTRQKDVSPTIADPLCVTSRIVGMEICGTVITVQAGRDTTVNNFAEGAIYIHYVLNVTVWDANDTLAGATFAAINIGDPVFYDEQADALGDGKLSTAQYMANGTTPKPRFGTIVMLQDECADDFAKGDATQSFELCAILQAGLNNSY